MNQEVILVIDDNQEAADMTAVSVLPSLGYNALVAYGSKPALDLIRDHHKQISLILVAMEMSDINGLELMQKVSKDGYDIPLTRAVSDRVNIPVIASGGVGNLEHIREGLVEGCASAALAASIFHFREYTIGECKDYLREHGVPVRV